MKAPSFVSLAGCAAAAIYFALPIAGFSPSITFTGSSSTTSTQLHMANEDDLMRWARSSRSAQAGDRVVELRRPLGVVLEADDSGNVYVDAVAPMGNAARSGLVKEGDVVVMCSATFGEQLWSTRGVGLTRVLSAIKIRAGPTVTLVLESPNESERKAKQTAKVAQAASEARQRAQAKKDDLLKQLQADEKKLKKGFFGLF